VTNIQMYNGAKVT